MNKNDKIYIAGHRGMVGSAIVRKLKDLGFNNLIVKTHKELDLINQADVVSFLNQEKPDYIFLAAAKVGGILANDIYSADFLYQNLMIETNIIHTAFVNKCKKLLFLGSSCIYPKYAEQPMTETALLTGLLEPTNEAYAIAKIAGIKMCDMYRKQYGVNFISAMPTNLYGYNDNFDLNTSHVIPALIRKIHNAHRTNSTYVEIWGTGTPKREFLFADDLAEACIYLMENYNDFGHVNIGTGEDLMIKEVAELIKEVIGYKGDFSFNTEKPDGTPRKLMNVGKINNLGWQAKTSLKDGLELVYKEIKDKLNI